MYPRPPPLLRLSPFLPLPTLPTHPPPTQEKEGLVNQVKGLKEELEVMQSAWLERDGRQRTQVRGRGQGNGYGEEEGTGG